MIQLNKEKKICSITTISNSTEAFVLPSMIYMRDNGWDITIITHSVNDFSNRIPKGIHFYDIPIERNYNIVNALKTIFIIFKACRRDRYTIIQYGTTHAALFGSIAAYFARVPIRIHLQWGIYDYRSFGIIKRFFLRRVEKLTCSLSTDIRPVSKKNLQIAVNEGLFKEYKGKVLGVGGTIGINLDEYNVEEKEKNRQYILNKYQIPNDAFVYGFIGRLSCDKGTNELLTAFRSLLTKSNNMHLILIGSIEGGIREDLMNWSKGNNQIIYTGPINHKEIPQYMSALNILVHPTYREGFGMVLQEAMAMMVPIITTDIPGPSEVIEENISGALVPAKNSEALEKKMLELYNDQDICTYFGINGRIRAEKFFNRPKMIDNIYLDKEELYRRLNFS